MMKYNSQRGKMKIREYGRYIQGMVDFAKSKETKEERTKIAKGIIEMMAILFPSSKSVEDYRVKLWNHLFILADYDLDVDCPYPTPTPEEKAARPARMKYPKQNIRYRHYGKSVEILISKALKMEDKEKQMEFAQGIATVMKMTYRNFSNDAVVDDTIKEDLAFMSNGVLRLDDESTINNMPLRNNTDLSRMNNMRNGRPNNNRNRNGRPNNNRNRNSDGTGSGSGSGFGNNKRRFNNNNNRNNNRPR